jgi:hypothetical protein
MKYWFCHSVLGLRRRPPTLQGLHYFRINILLWVDIRLFNEIRVIHVRGQLTSRSTGIYTHHNVFMRIEDVIRTPEAGVAVQLAATWVRVHPSKASQVWLSEWRRPIIMS